MDSPAGIFPSVLSQDLHMSCALCLGHSLSMAGTSSHCLSRLQCHLLREASQLRTCPLPVTRPFFSLTSVIEINLFF